MAGMCACSERGERGVRRVFGVSRVSRVGGGEGFAKVLLVEDRLLSTPVTAINHPRAAGSPVGTARRDARGSDVLCVSPPTATARLPAPPGPRRALVGPLLRPCRHTGGSTMTHHLQRHFLLEPTIQIHPRFILAHSLHTHTRTHTLRTAATNAALRSPTDSSLFQDPRSSAAPFWKSFRASPFLHFRLRSSSSSIRRHVTNLLSPSLYGPPDGRNQSQGRLGHRVPRALHGPLITPQLHERHPQVDRHVPGRSLRRRPDERTALLHEGVLGLACCDADQHREAAARP